MVEYEAEKAKWAKCTMEEWVKGADGKLFFAFDDCSAISFLPECPPPPNNNDNNNKNLQNWRPNLEGFWISYVSQRSAHELFPDALYDFVG